MLLMALALQGCRALKGTAIDKVYQNVTARFNSYFNAKERLLEVENSLFLSHPDNYNKVLDVFATGDQKTAKAEASKLDIAIKKAARVIQRKERSKWVDDSYFLIGKAHFYKRDFFSALETFDYVMIRYSNEMTGREAPVWKALTYIKMDKLNEAQAQISVLNTEKTFPDELRPFLNLVEAEYAIQTEAYKLAAEKLEAALPHVKGKKYKTRYMFILAQLYQRLGEREKATVYYRKVIKKKPVYDLDFQSRIGLSEVSTNKAEVQKYLTRLTRDEKNVAFNDQIFYTLARIEHRDGNTQKAIEYLQSSVRASSANSNQKALSFLMLADIYFAQPNYPLAKAYYDSAGNFIDNTFPGVDKFRSRQQVLGDLVSNLIIVQREDSLLKLSAMPEADLRARIVEIDEQNKRAAQQQNQGGQNTITPPADNFTRFDLAKSPSQGAGGYFWNPSALAIGRSDFINRWGERPLSDDWRRKDRPVANNMNPNNPNPQETVTDNAISRDSNIVHKEEFKQPGIENVPADLQSYYAGLPFTEAQRTASHAKIQDALFNIGAIYDQRLDDDQKAIDAYEALLRRYPNTRYIQQAHYNLYLLYLEQKNMAKAAYHKTYILENFPGSDYALLIENPEKLRDRFNRRHRNEALEKVYAAAFNSFVANDCQGVRRGKEEADTFAINYLRPRFEYMHIICSYRADSAGRLLDSLKAFSKRYPGDEVTKSAVELIKLLETRKKTAAAPVIEKKEAPAGLKAEEPKKPASPYLYDESRPHHFVLVIPGNANAQIAATALSNFNTANYAKEALEVNTFLVDDSTQIIRVKNFPNFNGANEYYNRLRNIPGFYSDFGYKKYNSFIISDTNYSLFMRNRDVPGYTAFFQNNY